MTEKQPIGSNIEGVGERQKYIQERTALELANPEPVRIDQLDAAAIEELFSGTEQAIADFEAEHNLDYLRSIETLTIEEIDTNLERRAANKALGPIIKNIMKLEKQPAAEYDRIVKLNAKYKILAAAVGRLNGGVVDHSIR